MSNATDFRPDIDGLRAVAVGGVVMFHLGVPGFGGGFVGVDVFFVISGFLILRALASELRAHGRVDLPTFWARRVRRLLPAASFVALASAIASIYLLPVRLQDTAEQLAASGVYGSNFYFLHEGKGYFEESVPRLLLHTWSLSVEEQFYVIVPIALTIAAIIGGRARGGVAAQPIVAVVLLVLMLASAWACASAPERDAFYSSPLRGWEFCIGGLVAVALPPIRQRVLREALAAVGLGVIVASLAGSFGGLRFPWPGAAIPVIGTCLVLCGNNEGCSVVGSALALAPMQWLGRLSYSLYLVHWPVLVFGGLLLRPLGGAPAAATIGLTSLGVATALHYCLERPLRHHSWWVQSRRRSLLVALGLAGVCCATAWVLANPMNVNVDAKRLLDIVGNSKSDTGRRCAGVQTLAELEKSCTYGKANAPAERTLLFVGDSHAMHWLPALHTLGKQLGVRIIYTGSSGCPAVPAKLKRDRGCTKWQRGLPALAAELRPAAVVVAHAGVYINGRLAGDDREQAWLVANRVLIAKLDAVGVPVALILDVPTLEVNPLDCFAIRGPRACSPTDREFDAIRRVHAVERKAFAGRPVFDPLESSALRCSLASEKTDRRCAAIDGSPMYRDTGHLTRAGSQAFVPELSAFVRQLLTKSERGN